MNALLLCLAAAVGAAPQFGSNPSGPPTGILTQTGVSLSNGLVRFRFRQGASGDVEFDVVDLTTTPPHALSHRGETPWLVEVLDLASKDVEQLTAADCAGSNVTWAKTSTTLTLEWSDCSALGDPGSFDLALELELLAGETIATWRLFEATNGMQDHTFWSGRFVLSLEEPQGGRFLLDPLSNLTTDPAVNLPTWSLGTPQCPDPRLRNPVFNYVTQLAAYYDDAGRGLYLQGDDPSASLPRSHFYNSVPASPPRMDYAYGVWQDDVLQVGNSLDDVQARIGRFQGDWIDAVELYRDWLAGTTVTSGGLLKDRNDLDPEILRMQQMIPLAVGVAEGNNGTSYTAGATALRNMWDAVHAYRGIGALPVPLQYVTAWQFGLEWAVNEDCGAGPYQLSTQWFLNFSNMETAGIPMFSYILDHDFAYDADVLDPMPTGECLSSPCRCTIGAGNDFFPNWEPVAMRALEPGANGIDFVPPGAVCAHDCSDPNFPPVPKAKIEPGTSEWLQRCADVAAELKIGGIVDGFFLDNLFPTFGEYCFSDQHAHQPGFGRYLQEGMADMTSEFQGTLGWIFTEAYQEFYVNTAASMAGSTSKADILTLGTAVNGLVDNPATVNVPLEAFVYHDYALSRPVNYSFPFMLDPVQGDIPPGALEYTVLSTDPVDGEENRQLAERGASYAIAHAVVNGSPLFCGDTNGLLSPMKNDWSFELDQTVQDFFDEAVRVLEMARRLSWYRGIDGFHEYLVLGKRRRDLPFAGSVPEAEVCLRWLTAGFPEVEFELVPDLVQGVWEDLETGHIGLAVANHSAVDISGASVTFDPGDYAGVGNTYDVTRLQPLPNYTGVLFSSVAQGLVGVQDIALPTIPAQDMVFLVFD